MASAPFCVFPTGSRGQPLAPTAQVIKSARPFLWLHSGYDTPIPKRRFHCDAPEACFAEHRGNFAAGILLTFGPQQHSHIERGNREQSGGRQGSALHPQNGADPILRLSHWVQGSPLPPTAQVVKNPHISNPRTIGYTQIRKQPAPLRRDYLAWNSTQNHHPTRPQSRSSEHGPTPRSIMAS